MFLWHNCQRCPSTACLHRKNYCKSSRMEKWCYVWMAPNPVFAFRHFQGTKAIALHHILLLRYRNAIAVIHLQPAVISSPPAECLFCFSLSIVFMDNLILFLGCFESISSFPSHPLFYPCWYSPPRLSFNGTSISFDRTIKLLLENSILYITPPIGWARPH